jgi:hypothetical protein
VSSVLVSIIQATVIVFLVALERSRWLPEPHLAREEEPAET